MFDSWNERILSVSFVYFYIQWCKEDLQCDECWWLILCLIVSSFFFRLFISVPSFPFWAVATFNKWNCSDFAEITKTHIWCSLSVTSPRRVHIASLIKLVNEQERERSEWERWYPTKWWRCSNWNESQQRLTTMRGKEEKGARVRDTINTEWREGNVGS